MLRRLFVLSLALLCLVFCALGSWQVQRHIWKQDLIARVDSRIHQPAVPAPPPAAWAGWVADDHSYRAVHVRGEFDHARQLFVQAATERGAGFWVLTPLRTVDGWWVWVNRGFVPPTRERRSRITEPAGTVEVRGLVRNTEPRGGFLRQNDPAAARWYSRDVAAMGAASGLPAQQLAPYFIDAAAGPDPEALPIGGLTVIRFSNNHLSYIFTWFVLAILAAVAAVYIWRHGARPGAAAHDSDGDGA